MRIPKWDFKKLKPALTLAAIVGCVICIAAVPGIFSTVNVTTGYQVNGTAGTSGQALCSNGTVYSVPCAVAGTPFYQTVDVNSITQPQEPVLAFSSNFVGTDVSTISTIVELTGVATGGNYLYPSSIDIDGFGRVHSVGASTLAALSTGTNGYYTTSTVTVSSTPTTLYDEDVNTGALGNDTTTTVTLPHAIPSVILSIVCSDNSSRVQSGATQAVGANTSGQSSPFSTIQVLSPATGESAYCHVRGY